MHGKFAVDSQYEYEVGFAIIFFEENIETDEQFHEKFYLHHLVLRCK